MHEIKLSKHANMMIVIVRSYSMFLELMTIILNFLIAYENNYHETSVSTWIEDNIKNMMFDNFQ